MSNVNSLNSDGRLTDSILLSLNRMHDAKLTGTLSRDEFANLITKIGKLYTGVIKNGESNGKEIDEMEAWLPGSNKIFDGKHDHLPEASRSFKEDIFTALAVQSKEREQNSFRRM